MKFPSQRFEPPFARLDPPPRPELPPLLTGPVLVTVYGVCVADHEFSVHVSQHDPNTWKGIGPDIEIRKKPVEDDGQRIVRRILARTATERTK